MDMLDIHAQLQNLHCYDTGEQGSAEPYLWTVFFKIDGSTCRITSDLTLTGTATVVGSMGRSEHNVGTDDVDEGRDVAIPARLGQFSTRLLPIPLDTPVYDPESERLVIERGGVFGIALVLIEADETPEEARAAGQRALANAIQNELNTLIPTLHYSIVSPHLEPTEEEIEEIKNRVASATENAVRSGVGVWDWLSGGGDMDDKIGMGFFYYSHSELTNPNYTRMSVPLSKRWQQAPYDSSVWPPVIPERFGDWELTGQIISQRPSKVTVYVDRDFLGRARRLEAGRYDVSQFGIGNDKLSSIRIPPGWKVTLFSEAGFWGDSVELTSDTAYVGDMVNDRTSSLIVEGPFVVIYEDAGYQGKFQILTEGRHNVGQLNIGNDTLSSVRVPPGWEVSLFAEGDFWGDSVKLTRDTAYVGNVLNDRTSSIIVSVPVVGPPR